MLYWFLNNTWNVNTLNNNTCMAVITILIGHIIMTFIQEMSVYISTLIYKITQSVITVNKSREKSFIKPEQNSTKQKKSYIIMLDHQLSNKQQLYKFVSAHPNIQRVERFDWLTPCL